MTDDTHPVFVTYHLRLFLFQSAYLLHLIIVSASDYVTAGLHYKVAVNCKTKTLRR